MFVSEKLKKKLKKKKKIIVYLNLLTCRKGIRNIFDSLFKRVVVNKLQILIADHILKRDYLR